MPRKVLISHKTVPRNRFKPLRVTVPLRPIENRFPFLANALHLRCDEQIQYVYVQYSHVFLTLRWVGKRGHYSLQSWP